MCIYCGTNKYRKIYEAHFGKIPREENGRSHEVDHMDGNHSNNSISNLRCVTLQEHYDIHFSQKDFSACILMACKLKLTPEAISRISTLNCLRMVELGTNPFSGGEMQRKFQRERVRNGTHHWQGNGDFQRENNRR